MRKNIYKKNIFVVFSKDILYMPLSELEKLLGELVEESKVCYTGSNE